MPNLSPRQAIKEKIKNMIEASEGKNRSSWDIADEALSIVENAMLVKDAGKSIRANVQVMTNGEGGKKWLGLVTDDGRVIGRQRSTTVRTAAGEADVAIVEILVDDIKDCARAFI